MGRRRSPAPLLLILAVVLMALPHLTESSGRHEHHHHGQRSHLQSRGHGGGDAEQVLSLTKEARRQWPCCDDCGGCTKSTPAQCRCMDAARGGCHPACRDCVRSALSVDPPVYHWTASLTSASGAATPSPPTDPNQPADQVAN